MKLTYKILLSVLPALVAIYLLFNSDWYITRKEWKIRKGSGIGDWISFTNKNVLWLEDGKIYRNNKHLGTVKLCVGILLWVENVHTREVSNYIKK